VGVAGLLRPDPSIRSCTGSPPRTRSTPGTSPRVRR
jgi:hypothetical protein